MKIEKFKKRCYPAFDQFFEEFDPSGYSVKEVKDAFYDWMSLNDSRMKNKTFNHIAKSSASKIRGYLLEVKGIKITGSRVVTEKIANDSHLIDKLEDDSHYMLNRIVYFYARDHNLRTKKFNFGEFDIPDGMTAFDILTYRNL